MQTPFARPAQVATLTALSLAIGLQAAIGQTTRPANLTTQPADQATTRPSDSSRPPGRTPYNFWLSPTMTGDWEVSAPILRSSASHWKCSTCSSTNRATEAVRREQCRGLLRQHRHPPIVDLEKMGLVPGAPLFLEAKSHWGEGINPEAGLFDPNADIVGNYPFFLNKWWYRQIFWTARSVSPGRDGNQEGRPVRHQPLRVPRGQGLHELRGPAQSPSRTRSVRGRFCGLSRWIGSTSKWRPSTPRTRPGRPRSTPPFMTIRADIRLLGGGTHPTAVREGPHARQVSFRLVVR